VARCPSDSRKLPRVPALAVEPLVGCGIVHELPLGRVPAQAAAVPVGQVAEDGDGHRTGADLHVGQGTFAGAYAVEPVAMVARGFREVDVLGAQGFLDDGGRVAAEVV